MPNPPHCVMLAKRSPSQQDARAVAQDVKVEDGGLAPYVIERVPRKNQEHAWLVERGGATYGRGQAPNVHARQHLQQSPAARQMSAAPDCPSPESLRKAFLL